MAGVQVNDVSPKAQEFVAAAERETVGVKSSSGEYTPKGDSQNSAYEGFGAHDSTTTGGFGRNQGGSAFSRAMGTAEGTNDDDDSYDNEASTGGNKTGASTPGYRRDGDDGQDVNTTHQFRGQNLSFTAAPKKDDDEPEI